MFALGFTGSRQGMSGAQILSIETLLATYVARVTRDLLEVHHGMCVGSDLDFHSICRNLHLRIIGHPGVGMNGTSQTRAVCDCDVVMPEARYRIRDRHIVEASQVLLATPAGFHEERRSGAWATIRCARGLRKELHIVYPDGTLPAPLTRAARPQPPLAIR